jgi:hypothetical protein
MAGNESNAKPVMFRCAHCDNSFFQPDGFATVRRCQDCIRDFAERFWKTMGCEPPWIKR